MDLLEPKQGRDPFQSAAAAEKFLLFLCHVAEFTVKL